MRLATQPSEEVLADIEVTDGSLALIVSDREVGEWPLDEIAVQVGIDGFHVRVEGEEFVFTTVETAAFARAVGVHTNPSGKTWRNRRDTSVSRARASKARTPRIPRVRLRSTVSKATGTRRPRWVDDALARVDFSNPRTRLAAAAVLSFAIMALLAPSATAAVLVTTGIVGLVVGGAASVDPILAARLPSVWPAQRLVTMALGAVAAGLLLLAF
jgi:hypothetical protein